MNDDTSQSRGRGLPRPAAIVAAAAGLALLTAACSGSGSSPRPGPAAHSACMRKHGATGFWAAAPSMSSRTSMFTLTIRGHKKVVQIPAKVTAAMQACRSLAAPPGQLSAPG
jgi:hypothetical protein